MKTIKLALALCVSLLTLASCKGEPGQPGLDGAFTIKTVLINVEQKMWQYPDWSDNNFFFATVNMPEITEPVFDKGIVSVYRVFNWDFADATQIALPYSRPVEIAGRDCTGARSHFTETLEPEYGIGTLTISYTRSDFNYEDDLYFVPEAMQFRCTIIY